MNSLTFTLDLDDPRAERVLAVLRSGYHGMPVSAAYSRRQADQVGDPPAATSQTAEAAQHASQAAETAGPRDEPYLDPEPAPEPAKPRGRPAGRKRNAQAEGAVADPAPARPEPNGLDAESEAASEAAPVVGDADLITIVREFCHANPNKSDAVAQLLSEYGARRVSEVPLDQRDNFLNALAQMGPAQMGPAQMGPAQMGPGRRGVLS